MSFKLEKTSTFVGIQNKEHTVRALVDSIAMQSVYFRKQGNFIAAENILLDGLQTHGRHPALLNALGNLYALSQSHNAATVPLEEAAEILLSSDAKIGSLPYYDPIINLSMHYRCMGRHQESYNALTRAWETYHKLDDPPFLYAEFAWMHTFAGNYIFACTFADRCFQNRAILPFEMLFFTQAAWSCRKLEKYADLILSKVIYDQQFEVICFLCAFILTTNAKESSINRMYDHLDETIIQQIDRLEKDNGMAASSLRPPLNFDMQRAIMTSIDHIVTGGRHAPFIQQH